MRKNTIIGVGIIFIIVFIFLINLPIYPKGTYQCTSTGYESNGSRLVIMDNKYAYMPWDEDDPEDVQGILIRARLQRRSPFEFKFILAPFHDEENDLDVRLKTNFNFKELTISDLEPQSLCIYVSDSQDLFPWMSESEKAEIQDYLEEYY
jgi:hypothetical protein